MLQSIRLPLQAWSVEQMRNWVFIFAIRAWSFWCCTSGSLKRGLSQPLFMPTFDILQRRVAGLDEIVYGRRGDPIICSLGRNGLVLGRPFSLPFLGNRVARMTPCLDKSNRLYS